MAMTMTQKILAAHSGKKYIKPGDFIYADLDIVLGNDITAPLAIEECEKAGYKGVFDKSKIALVPDHFTPNKDIKTAEQCKKLRSFAYNHDIDNYYEVGQAGIEHALLPEKGLIKPGQVIIGADSHTCTFGALGAFSTGIGSTDMAAGMMTGKAWFRVPEAIKVTLTGKLNNWCSGKDVILSLIGMIGVDGARYKSLEFFGDGIKNLTIDDRFTITNMAIEAGAKNGIFPVDEITKKYLKEVNIKDHYTIYTPDADAEYVQEIVMNLDEIQPVVAKPHLPENIDLAANLGDVRVDQVIIGSCTNGRISDLKAAYKVLKGKQVAKTIRLIIIPATQKIYLEAIDRGYISEFVRAGAVISPPSCGACLGGHMGVLGKDEVAIATTNRNFVGRMGHPESYVYLSNPSIAAASAIKGYISVPTKTRGLNQ